MLHLQERECLYWLHRNLTRQPPERRSPQRGEERDTFVCRHILSSQYSCPNHGTVCSTFAGLIHLDGARLAHNPGERIAHRFLEWHKLTRGHARPALSGQDALAGYLHRTPLPTTKFELGILQLTEQVLSSDPAMNLFWFC